MERSSIIPHEVHEEVPVQLEQPVTVCPVAEVLANVYGTPSASEQDSVLFNLVQQVDDSVPSEYRDQLLALFMKNRSAFSMNENDLGRTSVLRHAIETNEARPVRQPLRRHSPAHQKAISEHVAAMLEQRVIEPAQSPYASNLVLVRKKDGSLRCCVDYRGLNRITRKDAYPLPRTDTCLDAMSGARWFSTFDLRSSYHQVELEPRDSDKTAFICREGSFRFLTMPFGLCNAGATFQRLMDVVMAGLTFEACLVYLDDIIVYSSTIEQHIDRLAAVLQRLQRAGLKLKPSKCDVLQKSVEFLGHIVSAGAVGPHPIKVAAVADWPPCDNLRDLRAFLGLCGYYRKFILGFGEVAAPLYALTRKGCRFKWTQDCQAAFDEMKRRLTTAPVLSMPTEEDPYILDTDASDFAIGAVLSQIVDGEEHVIAYASKRLSRTEVNYCVTRRELLAVVFFLKYFRHHLLGRSFTVRTDHSALQWLRNIPEPVGQQARWIGTMEEYDFKIVHRPGTKHGNADAMSRRPLCRRPRCCPAAGDHSLPRPSQEDDELDHVATGRTS